MLISELSKRTGISAHTIRFYEKSGLIKGKTVAIHGLMNWILANSVRFTPRALVVKITRKIQDKAK